jgi:hypothetical protein
MKWRIFGSISFLSVTAAALWACHSSSSSDDTSGGLMGACQRVANATSAFQQKCGASLTAFGASDHDKHVIDRSTASCVAKYSLPGVPDQTANLNACASALDLAACNTEGVLAACALPTTGTLSNGSTCVQNDQCAGGLCLLTTSDAGATPDASAVTCGTCATATAPGQPCTDPTLCASGDCSGNPAVCEPLPTQTAAIGAACGNFNECAPPGYCNYDSTGNSGTCAASAGLDASCGFSGTGTTAPAPCEPQLTCVNNVCVQPPGYGESCAQSSVCAPGLFCGGGKCLGITYGPPTASCNGSSLQCVQGQCPGGSPFGPPVAVCPAIIADGKPCNASASGPQCDTLSACTNGICALVPSSTGCP